MGTWRRKWERLKARESNGKLPQELAQDAVCQSHTGHRTGLWFLPTRPLRLNTNEWMNEWMTNDWGFSIWKGLQLMFSFFDKVERACDPIWTLWGAGKLVLSLLWIESTYPGYPACGLIAIWTEGRWFKQPSNIR